MNIIERDRKFSEGQGALVHAVRALVRTAKCDPLEHTFLLVHRSSAALFSPLMANGGPPTKGGFAIAVGQRRGIEGDPLGGLPADMVACMVSVDGKSKALGLSVEDVVDAPAARDPKRPSAVPASDGSGDSMLNVAGIIRFLWEMDLDDSSKPELVARVRAWRQRVEVVRHACAVLSTPPSLDDLLWEHGNGAELERRMKACTAAGMTKTDFDIFDVILDEPKAG